MTNEEAIEVLRSIKPVDQGFCNSGIELLNNYGGLVVETAIDALENVDKYRWHYLRENPDDLPEIGVQVYVAVWNGNGRRYNNSWYDGRGWWNATSKIRKYYPNKSVVAWRYIEPFEVEE